METRITGEIMARVHSYARFSDLQQSDGESARRQLEASAAWVKTHSHKFSDLQFFDRGKSGFRGNKQKALNEFLKVMKAADGRVKPGDILLVESVDRLSRKGVRATQTLVNEILNHGVDIAILLPMEKVYKASEINDMAAAVELAAFAFQAHTYSSLLGSRVKDFHTEARKKAVEENKVINSGPTPAWLKRVGNKEIGWKFTTIPDRVAAIRHIFSLTCDGIGCQLLCGELNGKYWPMGRGKKWVKSYVRLILKDRRVLGEWQPHQLETNQKQETKRVPTGNLIPNYYPQIIDQKTFDAANRAIANRRTEKGPSSLYVNLFTGLIIHAIDKCPMNVYTFQQKRADGSKVTFRRIKSVNHIHGVPGASTATVNIMEFEKHFLGHLREIDLSVFDSPKNDPGELAELVAQLDKKTKTLGKLEIAAKDDDVN